MPRSKNSVRVTWSAVEIQANALLVDDIDVAIGAMIKAIDTASTQGREEFLVTNIAPDAPVGSARITEVQQSLEHVIHQAFDRLGRPTPECRLALRGDEYDLRLYLGRARPTDYRFD